MEFDYYSAIIAVLEEEGKAIAEYRNGNEKAFNYLFGKVDRIPWSTDMLPNGKPLTIGHKLDPEDIRKIIMDNI